jgi:hypothetical protein
MSQMGEIIAGSATLSTKYAEVLLKDVRPEQFARFAAPGGQPIESNHGAFIFGHLALYPPKVMTALGRPTDDVACPAEWVSLFEAGAECRDDPNGSIYPPMNELTERFFSGYERAIAAVAEADEAQLVAENPNEGMSRDFFPKLGSLVAFYVSGHVQSHLGQMSAWRRALGLRSAM